MKAAINTRYGPPEVVSIQEIPKPEPSAGEVLVKVHATTVNRTDCGMRTPYPFFMPLFTGLFKPKQTILGMDYAGVVESVGVDVTDFGPGDRVFGLTGVFNFGAHAEYFAAPADGAIAKIPDGISFAEAAPLEGAYYASGNLKGFGIKPGDAILIYGATGAIGSAAVQLAKAAGARVVAVCPGAHLDLVKSLGVDRVIDLDAEDFAQCGEVFDYVFDAVGKVSYFRCRKLIKPGGAYSATDFGAWGHVVLLAMWSSLTKSRRVVFPTPTMEGAISFMPEIRALMEKGAWHAVIDNRFAFSDIVDAYRRVETGQKVGNVVLEVVGDGAG